MKQSYKKEWMDESFELLRANGLVRTGQIFILRTAMNRPVWCAARVGAAAGGSWLTRTLGALDFLRLRAQWETAFILDTYFQSFFELFPGHCLNFPGIKLLPVLERAFDGGANARSNAGESRAKRNCG